MRSSTDNFGKPLRNTQRLVSLVVWAKPNPINRVRVVKGKRVLPNRGDVLPIRGR